jgi:hypothetical protein
VSCFEFVACAGDGPAEINQKLGGEYGESQRDVESINDLEITDGHATAAYQITQPLRREKLMQRS